MVLGNSEANYLKDGLMESRVLLAEPVKSLTATNVTYKEEGVSASIVGGRRGFFGRLWSGIKKAAPVLKEVSKVARNLPLV